jgi:hypothetical protein
MKKNKTIVCRVSLIGASAVLALGCTTKGTGFGATSSSNVTTYHNDLSRTGQNISETNLTRANVNSGTFGKVGALPVDGSIYAQPLYVSGVSIGNDTKNLVFVATEHDSVYAFDADAATSDTDPVTTPVWKTSLIDDTACTDSPCVTLGMADTLAPNIYPEVGITATPVIDQANGIIYVVGVDKEGSAANANGTTGNIVWKLHSLSLTTGQEMKGSPVVIAGEAAAGPLLSGVTNSGEGIGSDGKIAFQARFQLSRAGLVLSNGIVYVAFTSYNDLEPDHGWIFGYQYESGNFTQLSSFITTPSSGNGTIWMSGGAPAVDKSGNLFVATGNGDKAYLSTATQPDLSDSVLKVGLGGSTGLALSDYFTPYNWQKLAAGDVDLGAGGVLLLPDQPGAHPHQLIAGGKQGTIYVIDRDNMGKLSTSATVDNQVGLISENSTVVAGGTNHGPGIYGTPSYFNGNIYMMPAVGAITSIPVQNGVVNFSAAKKGTLIEEQRGSTTSISANGTSNGIVWYIDPSAYLYTYDYAGPPGGVIDVTGNGPGILTAFSTDDFTTPLYQSDAADGDANAAGDAIKFSVPTVANGLVFVGSQTELSIFGLKDRSGSSTTSSDTTASRDNSSRSFASINRSGKSIPWLDKLLSDKRKSCEDLF